VVACSGAGSPVPFINLPEAPPVSGADAVWSPHGLFPIHRCESLVNFAPWALRIVLSWDVGQGSEVAGNDARPKAMGRHQKVLQRRWEGINSAGGALWGRHAGDQWEDSMRVRNSTGASALVAAVVMTITSAAAFDESKYPDFGGQWRRATRVQSDRISAAFGSGAKRNHR